MKIIHTAFYTIGYSIIICLSLVAFSIFKPFTYIDNDHSYIHCFNDSISYETSPNLIFAVDKKLDAFNDEKARKLCQYKIISDYINYYKKPAQVNYELLPAYAQKSSWPAAVFAFWLTFILGSFITEAIGLSLKLGRSYFGTRFIAFLASSIG